MAAELRTIYPVAPPHDSILGWEVVSECEHQGQGRECEGPTHAIRGVRHRDSRSSARVEVDALEARPESRDQAQVGKALDLPRTEGCMSEREHGMIAEEVVDGKWIAVAGEHLPVDSVPGQALQTDVTKGRRAVRRRGVRGDGDPKRGRAHLIGPPSAEPQS